MPKETKVQLWTRLIEDQVQWIQKCGGSLAGYVARYGTATDPDRCGDGGEAIYRADMNYFEELTQNLNRAYRARSR